jgi:hypothetical protein
MDIPEHFRLRGGQEPTMRTLCLAILLGLSPPAFCADHSSVMPTSGETISIIELARDLVPARAVLTVRGKITRLNPAHLDLDIIKAMKPFSFETANHWTGEKEKFTGILLIDLLACLGLAESATQVDVIATNDYRVTIKISDLQRYEYLLSYARNGKDYAELMPSENKGPLAIAIDFNKHSQLDRDIYKHHLVWFVETIIVK